MTIKPHKLVVIGAGHVGDAIIADAMKLSLFGEIAIIDINRQLADGQALDQHHATALPMVNNIGVTAAGYETCKDADIIVITAGPSLIVTPDNLPTVADRAKLARTNSGVIRQVMAEVTRYTKDAIIIVCSNPLDPLVHVATTEFDYPRDQIIGTGTILDSARMCRMIADHLRIDPHYVRGYMLGEHGPAGFPYCSGINVGGMGFTEMTAVFGVEPLDRDDLTARINASGFQVLHWKGWTSAGVAQSALTIAQNILLDTRAVYPVCSTLFGEWGFAGDVSLSIPSIIGRNGIEKRLEVPLDEWEAEQLQRSAAAVRATIELTRPEAASA